MKPLMTKPFISVLFGASLFWTASLAQAQSNFDEEVNAELDRMYAPSGNSGASQTVNVNVVKGGAVQKQPTTVIEASPVVESRAERIRRERQEAELATEQKIVEKLEQSRIEDEKRRMDKVFGDRMDGLGSSQSQGQVVQPTPVVVAAPAATVVAEKPAEEEKDPSTYMGIAAGVPGYMDVGNIRPNYSAGLVLGRDLTSHMNFEGSFLFSNYEIRQPDGVVYLGSAYPRLTNMDHLQATVAIKGIFLEGRFRPNGGALVGFSHRTYRDTRIAIDNNTANSQSIDWGLTAGFDVELTKKFALGLDLRYLWNLTTRSSADNVVRPWGQMSNANPLEKLSYYQLLLAGKYYF